MYSTVRIMTADGTGTGFVYNIKIENRDVLVIVINKHVLNYNNHKETTIRFYVAQNDEPVDNIEITMKVKWHFHSSLDLAVTPLVPIINSIYKNQNKVIYYKCISEDMIYSKNKLYKLLALEQVVMGGYPKGLCEIVSNLPLFKTGYTAHPVIDFSSNQ